MAGASVVEVVKAILLNKIRLKPDTTRDSTIPQGIGGSRLAA